MGIPVVPQLEVSLLVLLTQVAPRFPINGRTGCSSSSYLDPFNYFFPVTASPLEDGVEESYRHRDLGPLRTIGPSARFVVLYDSSHHSGANFADPEVILVAMSDATEARIVPLSLFCARKNREWFDAGVSDGRAIGASSEEIYVPEWTVTKGFGMNDGRLCANMIDHFTPPAFFKTVRYL
ncbi:hypothetical protein Tco_1504217 [Tanacetum coccineum]